MRILSRNSFILAILLGLVGSVFYLYSPKFAKSRGDRGGIRSRFGKVKRGDLIQRVTVSGVVTPARRTIFVAPYSGYIQRIYVKIGEKIKKGDPVLSITSSLQNPEPVYPIRAPFAGTVVGLSKYEGEYVTEKDTKDIIARVDDLSNYYVVAKAPETDAARIKKDMKVEIKVNALRGGALSGVVRDIELAAEEGDGWRSQSSTFKVTVEVTNPPSDLRSGQTAIIDIVTKKFADVLYLEHEFINSDGDKYFVMDRAGHRHDIEVGNQSDLAAEIKSGLKEGDEAEQVDFLKLLESGT